MPTKDHRTIFEAEAGEYVVPESRVFTYPTRLADTYAPECLEIVKPPFSVSLPPVRLDVERTRSSRLPTFPRYSVRRRGFMRVAPPLRLSGVTLLDLRHEVDVNISHLVTFAMPQAILARRHLDTPLKVVLKARTSELSKKVVRAFGFDHLCTDRDIDGDFIVGSDGHDRAYERLYPTLFDGQVDLSPPAQLYERIYISRRDRRKLVNEDEIHSLLARLGFQRLFFEDFPVAQQWAFARHARVIVALHGAALSSVLFARPGVSLIEIFHPGFTVNFFRRLVHLVGGRWCGVTGKIPSSLVRRLERRQDSRAYAFESTELHPDTLRRALSWLSIST
jgi:hypothetical protein